MGKVTDDEIHETRTMVRELHDALLAVPVGSPSDVKPLLEDLRVVVRAYHRASWATRILIWILPFAAATGGAFLTLKGWFIK